MKRVVCCVLAALLLCASTPFAMAAEVPPISTDESWLLSDEMFSWVCENYIGTEEGVYQIAWDYGARLCIGDTWLLWVSQSYYGEYPTILYNSAIDWGNPLSGSFILAVDIKEQSEHNCWAAAVAAIVSYKTQYNVTAAQVCSSMKFLPDVSGDIDDAMNALRVYGVNSKHYPGVLSYDEVVSQINAKQPLFLQCFQYNKHGDPMWHAVVLRGYKVYGDQADYYFMDSATGSYFTRRVSMAYSGELCFSLPGGYLWEWQETIGDTSAR